MSPTKNTAKKATHKTAKTNKGLLSDDELAAMKETLRERKANASKEEAEKAALAAIAAMKEPDRSMAKRIHAIIKECAPSLASRTWYGMPAYANEDGKVICFFQTGQKFKTRYCTLGFSDSAHLDEGVMWPNSYALMELTPAEEARIAALVKQAVS